MILYRPARGRAPPALSELPATFSMSYGILMAEGRVLGANSLRAVERIRGGDCGNCRLEAFTRDCAATRQSETGLPERQ